MDSAMKIGRFGALGCLLTPQGALAVAEGPSKGGPRRGQPGLGARGVRSRGVRGPGVIGWGDGGPYLGVNWVVIRCYKPTYHIPLPQPLSLDK